jgi:hypothetical protein
MIVETSASRLRLAVLAGALMLAPAAQAAATVTVLFVHPERFNDKDFRNRYTPGQRAAAVAELTRHIQRAAQALLPPGRTLQVEILDLQRAGMYNPEFGTAANVRILGSVNPPRIVLRYKLGGSGPARAGSATLTDVDYLANPYARSSGDRFIYEKALLDDWLRKIATR